MRYFESKSVNIWRIHRAEISVRFFLTQPLLLNSPCKRIPSQVVPEEPRNTRELFSFRIYKKQARKLTGIYFQFSPRNYHNNFPFIIVLWNLFEYRILCILAKTLQFSHLEKRKKKYWATGDPSHSLGETFREKTRENCGWNFKQMFWSCCMEWVTPHQKTR